MGKKWSSLDKNTHNGSLFHAIANGYSLGEASESRASLGLLGPNRSLTSCYLNIWTFHSSYDRPFKS